MNRYGPLDTFNTSLLSGKKIPLLVEAENSYHELRHWRPVQKPVNRLGEVTGSYHCLTALEKLPHLRGLHHGVPPASPASPPTTFVLSSCLSSSLFFRCYKHTHIAWFLHLLSLPWGVLPTCLLIARLSFSFPPSTLPQRSSAPKLGGIKQLYYYARRFSGSEIQAGQVGGTRLWSMMSGET